MSLPLHEHSLRWMRWAFANWSTVPPLQHYMMREWGLIIEVPPSIEGQPGGGFHVHSRPDVLLWPW